VLTINTQCQYEGSNTKELKKPIYTFLMYKVYGISYNVAVVAILNVHDMALIVNGNFIF